MLNNETIKYYNENAKEYFETSVRADMSDLYAKFVPLVPQFGSVLDIGCGSGRDLKYFSDLGYDAEGIELSHELKELAELYSGCSVYEAAIQDYVPTHPYDALWACASLLHLTKDEIRDFFQRLGNYLIPGGIILVSMKSGIPTGPDSKNRYFTDCTEGFVESILQLNEHLSLVKLWYTKDTLNRGEFKWLNFIIRLLH